MAEAELARPTLRASLPPHAIHVPAPPSTVPHQHALLAPSFTSGLQGAGIGLFVSAVRNSLESHNKGGMGVFTRTGWLAGWFASIGFTYSFVSGALANNLSPSANSGALASAGGGCAAGFIAGIKSGSIPQAAAMCALMGGTTGTYRLAGGNVGGKWDGKPEGITAAGYDAAREKFFRKRADAEE